MGRDQNPDRGKPGGKTGEVVGDVIENTVKKGKGFKFPGIAGGLLSLGGTVTALATATSPEEDAAVEGSEERWKRIRARYTQEEIDAARKKYQPWWQFGEGYSTENEEWLRRWEEDRKKPQLMPCHHRRRLTKPQETQSLNRHQLNPDASPSRNTSRTGGHLPAPLISPHNWCSMVRSWRRQ
ncbi:hypothetical protein O5699_04240 [Escherichia coli]|nr:hypothetical protein [Escherichia coli]